MQVEGDMLRVVVQPAPASSAAAMATAQRILHNVQVTCLVHGFHTGARPSCKHATANAEHSCFSMLHSCCKLS